MGTGADERTDGRTSSRADVLGYVFASPPGGALDLVEPARRLGVATVAAAMGEPDGRDLLVAHGVLRRASGSGVVAGWAVTAWNPPGNNTMLRFSIEACRPGDVLVVSTPANGAAQWGELAHEWASAVGVAGVIIDGSARDVALVRELGMSLWARTIDPRQALKESPGFVNAPISVGGVRIEPGDLVVGDDDGVLVVPRGQVEVAIRRAERRAAQEEVVRADARAGLRSPALTALFDEAGIVVSDVTWRDHRPNDRERS